MEGQIKKTTDISPLRDQFKAVRDASVCYGQPLSPEDYGLQAMPDTSPAKWHLAHTTWFFETFILKPFADTYRVFHPQFEYLFNSYYNGVGAQFPRPQRGLLSRPAIDEVRDYRAHVDVHLMALLSNTEHPHHRTIVERVELGLHHENQHQELFFTDLKYNFHCNPLYPCYKPLDGQWHQADAAPLDWVAFEGGIAGIGAKADGAGFVFDNETPHHRVWLEPFQLASRPVTNGEYLAFIEAGGYQESAYWLSDGWACINAGKWTHPLYWHQQDGQWFEFTLHGLQPLDPSRTACHLSAYEADAYARWAGARLPTEFEWEVAAAASPVQGHFVARQEYHPGVADDGHGLSQMFGSVWEWTSSAYSPYPGFKAPDGAIGEYNGKFMCNQLVLRGGSCVSDQRHIRHSYRNFFYPPDRWQFSGIRLAKDGENQ